MKMDCLQFSRWTKLDQVGMKMVRRFTQTLWQSVINFSSKHPWSYLLHWPAPLAPGWQVHRHHWNVFLLCFSLFFVRPQHKCYLCLVAAAWSPWDCPLIYRRCPSALGWKSEICPCVDDHTWLQVMLSQGFDRCLREGNIGWQNWEDLWEIIWPCLLWRAQDRENKEKNNNDLVFSSLADTLYNSSASSHDRRRHWITMPVGVFLCPPSFELSQ